MPAPAKKKRQQSKRRSTPKKKPNRGFRACLVVSLFTIAVVLVFAIYLQQRKDEVPLPEPPSVDGIIEESLSISCDVEEFLSRGGYRYRLDEADDGGVPEYRVDAPFPDPLVVADFERSLALRGVHFDFDIGRRGGSIILQRDKVPLARVLFVYTPLEPKPSGPRIALIIDDIGEDLAAAQALVDLPYPVTFSVLPVATHASGIAEMVSRCGREVLLHIPMEPLDYPRKNPGRDALFVSYDDSELRRRFSGYLERVPQATGGNNHMGSRFTESRAKMRVILDEMEKKGLFFVDSLTSPRSVGFDEARSQGVPAASRDIFLDNVRDVKMIERQLVAVIERGLTKGQAIGIGHPYPETIKALKKIAPVLKEKGIEVVPVSRLLTRREPG